VGTILKKIGATISALGLLLLILAIVGVLVVTFGSCKNAAWVAGLAPNMSWLNFDRLAPRLMELHRGNCAPDVTAAVTRYCHNEDLSADEDANRKFAYFEEAASVELSVDGHGIPIDQLDLTVDLGVTSGVASTDADAYCWPGRDKPCKWSCGVYPYAPYVEVLDRETREFTRGAIKADPNSGHWTATYTLHSPIPAGGAKLAPIRYYAVISRSQDPSLSCEISSRPSTIKFSSSYNDRLSDGKTYPLLKGSGEAVVTTKVVSWLGLLAEPDRARDFRSMRNTGTEQIRSYKKCENDSHDQRDQSGWRFWPHRFPEINDGYPATHLQFCAAALQGCQVSN
jgi:hypothetical protein